MPIPFRRFRCRALPRLGKGLQAALPWSSDPPLTELAPLAEVRDDPHPSQEIGLLSCRGKRSFAQTSSNDGIARSEKVLCVTSPHRLQSADGLNRSRGNL